MGVGVGALATVVLSVLAASSAPQASSGGVPTSPVELDAVAAQGVATDAEVQLTTAPWSDGAEVSWTPVLGAVGYDLFRAPGTREQVGAGPEGWVRVSSDLISQTRFRDAGLTAGKTYTYAVKARYPEVAATAELRRPVDLPTSSVVPADPLASFAPLLSSTCPAAAAKPGTLVRTAEQLTAALAGARPGDVIRLADGTYRGPFRLSAKGTSQAPVWLCGGRGAVLENGSTSSGTALRIDSASHVGVSGFTVTRALHGVFVKGSSDVVVTGLAVQDIGYEGVHVYGFSEDVVVRGNRIQDTGVEDVAFGEGVYVGTSDRRWEEVTGGEPDTTRRVAVVANTITDAGAEPIEAKMGTSDGIIQGNTLRGHQPGSRARAWVLVTGNDWLVRGNDGSGAVNNGYMLMRQGGEWGHDNSVVGNTGAVDAPGWGVLLQNPGSPPPKGAIVGCDNYLTGATAGAYSGPCQN
ncbi:right-handed parallel beta-helix repeat-containing protein [Streptomyces sp. NP160]|uniref:right-handed parallel beta-helix repeat-containing protein n=1 Tax=Streptomyces sp. NP160 TaxID=2586637 RepID=UPI001C58EEB2|nr:right-handed parallel beta-helix repeat-containing protein [Streptomyces sp. NP160]